MKTAQAIKLAGSREALARMLGVASITTYRWKPSLPAQRIWQLQVLRPEWFKAAKRNTPAAPEQAETPQGA